MNTPRQSFALSDMMTFVNLSERQIKYWDKVGILCASEPTRYKWRFTFADIATATVLMAARRQGMTTQRIRIDVAPEAREVVSAIIGYPHPVVYIQRAKMIGADGANRLHFTGLGGSWDIVDLLKLRDDVDEYLAMKIGRRR